MFSLLLTLAALPSSADAPKPIRLPLWTNNVPMSLGDTDKDKPVVTLYQPAKEKRTRTAIVVCPGGGYGGLAMSHEGKEIAAWLVERGVTAFVLEYRLGPRYNFPVPLLDAQRAMRLARSKASEYHYDPQRVGIWGFSAGGHLASTVSTRFDEGKKDSADVIDHVSCRPDFAILCYPVIRMDAPYGHAGSRRNLLGEKPDEKLLASLCNDTQVSKKTPPTFLFHTRGDKPVPPENSELYYKALQEAGVPAHLEMRENGPHGVGLAQKYADLKDWPDKLEKWLKERKVLGEAGKE